MNCLSGADGMHTDHMTVVPEATSEEQYLLLQMSQPIQQKCSLTKLIHLAENSRQQNVQHVVRNISMDNSYNKHARLTHQKGNLPVRSWYIIMPKLHMSEACK